MTPNQWNRNTRDSVVTLLTEAGFSEDSSVINQLECMNFDAPAAPQSDAVIVPDGYRLVAVNGSFSDLIYQLDQASENSNLDMVGNLAESWESFDYEYLDNPSTQEGEKQ